MATRVFVSWPSAPLTESLVLQALEHLSVSTSRQLVTTKTLNAASKHEGERLLQWSTYDQIDHDLTHTRDTTVFSSSYTIRKALIRKHFLHRCIVSYLAKRGPDSILRVAFPKTWDVEISFADELEDMWMDELWDLGKGLDGASEGEGEDKWWILKPGMADGGNGIRLFNSKEALQEIFESFEIEDDDQDDDVVESPGRDRETSSIQGDGIVMSQLRHFVIQEYISNPLLVDPREIPVSADGHASVGHTLIKSQLRGHKFHLRVYCVASGALSVYLYSRVLVLFSSEPYTSPSGNSASSDIDMRIHLTNTCVQEGLDADEKDVVRLLNELVGCHVLPTGEGGSTGPESPILMEEDTQAIMDDIAVILSETFQAALQSPVHFQPLPNAFELFGVDFLLSHPSNLDDTSPSKSSRFRIDLLEINAEPAIERTGERLKWILKDMLCAIGEECIAPALGWTPRCDEHSKLLRKCFEAKIRA